MSWEVVYTKHALKDAQKIAASGLKGKAQALLALLKDDPFRSPPPFEKLVGPDGHPKLLHLWPVKLLQAGQGGL